MQFELTNKEFRRLLDLVYIGNWVLNSTRGDDRFADYDHIESKLFGLCAGGGMQALVESWNGIAVPSRAFAEGGYEASSSLFTPELEEQFTAALTELINNLNT